MLVVGLMLTIPTIVIAFTNPNFVSNWISLYAVIVCFSFHLFFQLFFTLLKNQKSRIIPQAGMSLPRLQLLVLVILILVVSLILLYGDFNSSFSNFSNLYANREIFVQSSKFDNSLFLGYAIGSLGWILVPVLCLLGIFTRNFLHIAISLFAAAYVFSLTSQKWIFASIFLVICLTTLAIKNKSHQIPGGSFVNFFNGLITTTLLISPINSVFPLVDLVVRRAILDPAITLQFYVKYSFDFPFRFWRDTLVFRIFSGEGGAPASEIIGDRYFSIPEKMFFSKKLPGNATAGAIQDSLAQAGFAGLLLTTFLLFLFFRMLDIFSSGKNSKIVFVVSAMISPLLIEGTLHTLLLSRGLILIPFFFLLLPSNNTS